MDGTSTCAKHVDTDARAATILNAEEDADTCSICLEVYTTEDPALPTTCGHSYHLQCIMQWAQRSRECPLCFRALELKDPSMHELLPFGELAPPTDHAADLLPGLQPWELAHILRLASHHPGGQASMAALIAARHHSRPNRYRIPAMPSTSSGHSVFDAQAPGRRSKHIPRRGSAPLSNATGGNAPNPARSESRLPRSASQPVRSHADNNNSSAAGTPEGVDTQWPRDSAPARGLFARCKASLTKTRKDLTRALSGRASSDSLAPSM